MDTVPDAVAPSTRGAAHTTWFGWETFDVSGSPLVIDDSTPDIGTATGVNFHTTDGGNHRSSSGNFYSTHASGPNELVTVVTDGTVGSTGFTTVIAQLLTSGGPLGGTVIFGPIEGVSPTVVQGTNNASKGQAWALWKVPGNKASYAFTITGAAGTADYSFDRVVVDTSYSATAVTDDTMTAMTPPLVTSLNRANGLLAPSSRGTAKSTYFGWDTFADANGLKVGPINDSTPDVGTTTAGVNFMTNNGGLHYSPNPASNNFYAADGPTDETVTVVTNGTVGATGTTTIIAQAVTSRDDFPSGAPLVFSSINGVAPTVVAQQVNQATKGQVWAKWEIPGNQATYTFTVKGQPSTSFDFFVVDTVWKSSGSQGDSVTAMPVPLASIMDRTAGLVVPSSRGDANTTWFGWETFSDVNGAYTGVVNDSAPDIGTTTSGANFQTTNSQVHHIGGGSNIYVRSHDVNEPPYTPQLAEQVTIPTSGTPGVAGFTTIILQIESASGGPSTSAFAGPITVKLEGADPTSVVQSVNTSLVGDLWAKWVIPGNKASYIATITGVLGQEHYSFDHVIVDTLFSAASLGDTMVASNLGITDASLPVGKTGTAYAPVTLAATAGTAPFTWEVVGTPPDGLAISAAGVLSGTPTTVGASTIAVKVTDHLGNTATRSFAFTAAAPVVISSTSPLAATLIGSSYSTQLAAGGGTAPFAWTKTGALPAGLSLDGASGVISGISTEGGVFDFTVQVTDANLFTDTKAFHLTVAVLEITTPSLVAGVKGQPYSQTLTASGGTGTLVWTLDSGSLPLGLTLGGTGILSGKPTTPVVAAPFTVKVTDSNHFAIPKSFTLTVTGG
ncbi:MAG: putative Ig protein [Verrucomicrobiaceae bacterium]|nr:putative Ig protein [Verrucomicrobiaceae bacterium]